MKRSTIIYGIIALVVLILIAGVGVALFVLGGTPNRASGPISAPELAVSASDSLVFEITQEESTARFLIDEVLRGEPQTVVGQTNQVAGFIAVDPDDFDNTEVGTVRINARTLVTDDSRRNRMLNNRILHTDQFEFIEFTPTTLEGLPDEVAIGEPFTFNSTGDLTIRDVTRPVTFEVMVTPVSETRLEATAAATVQHADYDLVIPSVPFVADVSDEVHLEIDFVAITN